MFKKVLIANRGEIALRVICACKELGIPTVGVYSEPDSHSPHVRFADEAVCIGPAKSYESYLNIPSIISAAEITNVDAIHPGYGYLAESAYFAEVCETCGIKFIGPDPETIELMGDKARARQSMKEAGLPIIPGSDLITEEEDDKVERVAKKIGFPLIIKAAAGGGGRGMRIVRRPEDLRDSLDTAQSEAQGAFGSSDVYIERYLDNPRHVEFQILGDEHGNAIHLGERECSIQRRHQKLIEETPSPVVSSELREELGSRVVKAMKEVGYRSAGTVEFLFDQNGEYFFIEMNTRVQVEHPITEMISGVDIVKEQIKVAAGEQLELEQARIAPRGHCIECRLNAEDPVTFRPSPGTITAYNPPGGPGIRVDSTAYQDWIVSSHYDSLIAKLVAYGVDRQESIARMKRALEMFVIEGIDTSIPLHLQILSHPGFVAGEYGTSFLEEIGIVEPSSKDA
jgi:acetyl-CoA carboxylase biotin carboxylase subunit